MEEAEEKEKRRRSEKAEEAATWREVSEVLVGVEGCVDVLRAGARSQVCVGWAAVKCRCWMWWDELGEGEGTSLSILLQNIKVEKL